MDLSSSSSQSSLRIVYLVAFFSPWIPGLQMFNPSTATGWHEMAVGIPVLLFVLLVLVISGWIGWTMLTTPPPAPLEPEPAMTSAKDIYRNYKSLERDEKSSSRKFLIFLFKLRFPVDKLLFLSQLFCKASADDLSAFLASSRLWIVRSIVRPVAIVCIMITP